MNRLEVMPHGFNGANAYYDPAKPALAFGYFFPEKTTTDRQIPGRPDYACLDHGILVHETTHALLDGLRPSLSLFTSFGTSKIGVIERPRVRRSHAGDQMRG